MDGWMDGWLGFNGILSTQVAAILRIKSTQNCYNADKVLSFVSPSGEQEWT